MEREKKVFPAEEAALQRPTGKRKQGELGIALYLCSFCMIIALWRKAWAENQIGEGNHLCRALF